MPGQPGRIGWIEDGGQTLTEHRPGRAEVEGRDPDGIRSLVGVRRGAVELVVDTDDEEQPAASAVAATATSAANLWNLMRSLP